MRKLNKKISQPLPMVADSDTKLPSWKASASGVGHTAGMRTASASLFAAHNPPSPRQKRLLHP